MAQEPVRAVSETANRMRPSIKRQLMPLRRILSVGLIFAACAALLPVLLSQEEDVTITVDVNVVNVLATVRDKQGRLVTDLTKEDFVLEEEGRPQTIRYFTRQTHLPLTIGLLVDTSISQERVIEPQRRASFQFFSQVLRHRKDLAFLISFDVDIELMQDLTDSQKLLGAALNKLRVQGSRAGMHPGPVPTSRRPVGTALFDAVYLAADEIMVSQVGRKALVLISDGNDYGSRMKREDAIAASHRADVVIYSVRYFDNQFYNRSVGRGRRGSTTLSLGGGGGASTLKELAKETGGAMFEVKRDKPLDEIYQQIQDELRGQYSIGYRSDGDPAASGFLSIKLISKRKDVKVQTRSGYYAKPA